MASHISKLTLRSAIQTRGYAQCVRSSGILSTAVQTSTLSNKLIIASADNNSPLTRVSVQFKAGSRNENPDNAGVTHMMRLAAGLTTKNASQFAITRNVQQLGANLYCSTDRETISYTLEGTLDVVEKLLPYLGEVATQQCFRPWEVEENLHRARVELASRPPQQRAIDLLHKAAYRRGLGNSIFISKSQLGKVESETLQHYVGCNFLSGRCAVVGLGIDHETLASWAGQLTLAEGSGETVQSPYKGGEIRSDKGGDLAFVAVGTESAGLSSKDALAFCVLKYALGAPPAVKYGQSSGLLARAAGTGNYGITAMNVAYSDSGLFGVLAAADAANAGKIVEAAVKVLRSPDIKENDVKRGKNAKKMELLSTCEGSNALEFIGNTALYTGSVPACADLLSAVDSITIDDVQRAAQKVCKGKLSIAAVGNLRNVPFLDELH